MPEPSLEQRTTEQPGLQQTSGTNKNLFGISFPDVNTCYAVGDTGTIHQNH